MTQGSHGTVCIIQDLITNYTADLFNKLYDELEKDGIHLTVLAGRVPPGMWLEDGFEKLHCATRCDSKAIGRHLIWQPVMGKTAQGFDLVVFSQHLAFLANYLLIARRYFSGPPPLIAFWGHGINFQAPGTIGARQWLKKLMIPWVDHWFAYTQISADIVVSAGMPGARVTVLNNSIDTSLIASERLALTAEKKYEIRKKYGLGQGPLAVFCSRILKEKKLPFLIDACEIARQKCPGLELAVIGDGPLTGWLAEKAMQTPWIHPFGARYDIDKVEIMIASDILSMPALVGLSILEGFAAGLPLMTTNYHGHGPEIAYLSPGQNGILAPATLPGYANAIANILNDEVNLKSMSAHALATSNVYTLNAMVDNFTRGIKKALIQHGNSDPK